MLTEFICPDGIRQKKSECLSGHCRMASRCAPLTYLDLAGRERAWSGVPSVTQLIDGTRRQYLLLTTDYALSPAKAAYRVLGTRGHVALDTDNDFSFTEEHFNDGDIMGTADMIEKQEDGSWMLVDHKTAGSYKVAKALGIEKIEKIICDAAGVPMKHKNGKVMKDRSFAFSGERDIFDWQMQTNMYRIKLEEKLGEKITKIKIFVIVRDGNTFSAKNRGVFGEIYYIDIPLLEDDFVLQYFMDKRNKLLYAVDNKICPEECSPKECWDGNKCKLCEVAAECVKAGRSYTVEGEDE